MEWQEVKSKRGLAEDFRWQVDGLGLLGVAVSLKSVRRRGVKQGCWVLEEVLQEGDLCQAVPAAWKGRSCGGVACVAECKHPVKSSLEVLSAPSAAVCHLDSHLASLPPQGHLSHGCGRRRENLR